MTQRIQTIWLFLATLALFSLFLFPSIQVVDPDGSVRIIKASGVYGDRSDRIGQTVKILPFCTLTVMTIVLGLIPAVIAFFHQNRKRQIMACYLTILAIVGYSFYFIEAAKQAVNDTVLGVTNYRMGLVFPSLAILFIILAIRGIRNDERLIKSADRLR